MPRSATPLEARFQRRAIAATTPSCRGMAHHDPNQPSFSTFLAAHPCTHTTTNARPQDGRDIARASCSVNHRSSTAFCSNRAVRPHSAPTKRGRNFTATSVVIRKARPHFDSPPSPLVPLSGSESTHIASSNSTVHRGTPVPPPLPHRPLQPLKCQSPAFSHVALRCCPPAAGQHSQLRAPATS